MADPGVTFEWGDVPLWSLSFEGSDVRQEKKWVATVNLKVDGIGGQFTFFLDDMSWRLISRPFQMGVHEEEAVSELNRAWAKKLAEEILA